MMRQRPGLVLLSVMAIGALGPPGALAQPQEAERCEQVDRVRVCAGLVPGETALGDRLAALASALAGVAGEPAGLISIAVDGWSAEEIALRVARPGDDRALRVPLADLPPEPGGLDARARTIALAVAADLGRDPVVESPSGWTDERPLATAAERSHYLGFREETFLRPAEPGLTALTIRVRALPTLDRAGAALGTELELDHLVSDVLTLGIEVAPAWLALGERISGGVAGGLAALHLVFDGDVIALGVYGGVAVLPRARAPLASVFGLRIRIGLYDFFHADLRASLAYADGLGVTLGQVRGDLLVPVDASIEVLVVRFDVAFELGWIGAEAGVRIWPSARRSQGDFGIEIAVGGRAHVFLQRCEFGGCAPEWGAGGASLSVALLARMR